MVLVHLLEFTNQNHGPNIVQSTISIKVAGKGKLLLIILNLGWILFLLVCIDAPPKLTGWAIFQHTWLVFFHHQAGDTNLVIPNRIGDVIIAGFLLDRQVQARADSRHPLKPLIANFYCVVVATTIMVVNTGGASPPLLFTVRKF